MNGPFADRLFRIAFTLAGFYNLAFGFWACLWPLHFFAMFDLAPPRYPGIWACLGMVVGVYGFLYLHAARHLETAWSIIAVGFLGKVLGPIGMVMSFGDDWPRRIGMLCIYNDLIWWLPFGLFLVRGNFLGHWLEKAAPWICIAFHLLGAITAVLFLRQGTLTESDAWFRATYIAGHINIWSLGWFLWMLSALSFVGFCAWWASRLPMSALTIAAVVIAALGTVFDLSGEGSSILLLVEQAATALQHSAASATAWDAAQFIAVERYFTLLSAGIANLLYTIAGAMLTIATPNLPRWIRGAIWATWAAGIVMTIAAIFDHVGGLVTSSFVLFPLMIGWVVWMGTRWRPS